MIGTGARMREKTLAGAILVLVFAAGALSAAAVLRVTGVGAATTPQFAGDFVGAPAGPGPLSPGRLAPELVERLALDSTQLTAAIQILGAHNDRSRQILEGLRPDLEAQLDSARSGIRDLLSPEQQEIFDAYLEEHRGFTERRFGGGRRGRDGRGDSDGRGRGRRGRG